MPEADPRRQRAAVVVLSMNLEGSGGRGGEFGMSSVSCGNGKLRQWLIDQIDSGKYPGLVWENEEKSIFRIPWKHAGKQDYNREEDAALFKVTRTWGARGLDPGRAPEIPAGPEQRFRGEPGPRLAHRVVLSVERIARVRRAGVGPVGRAAAEHQVAISGSQGRSFSFSADFTNGRT